VKKSKKSREKRKWPNGQNAENAKNEAKAEMGKKRFFPDDFFSLGKLWTCLKKVSHISQQNTRNFFPSGISLYVCNLKRKAEGNLTDMFEAIIPVDHCLYQRSVMLCFGKGFFTANQASLEWFSPKQTKAKINKKVKKAKKANENLRGLLWIRRKLFFVLSNLASRRMLFFNSLLTVCLDVRIEVSYWWFSGPQQRWFKFISN